MAAAGADASAREDFHDAGGGARGHVRAKAGSFYGAKEVGRAQEEYIRGARAHARASALKDAGGSARKGHAGDDAGGDASA